MYMQSIIVIRTMSELHAQISDAITFFICWVHDVFSENN